MVLCFSPMDPEFRARARKFPALVSCTVIDWFHPWPKEALASVGTRFLTKSRHLEDPTVRIEVERFMINSFEGVNAMCTKVSTTHRSGEKGGGGGWRRIIISFRGKLFDSETYRLLWSVVPRC